MSTPNPITRLNTALEGRYTVEGELGEGELGEGGMAHDVRACDSLRPVTVR